jgi:hypothetical protein
MNSTQRLVFGLTVGLIASCGESVTILGELPQPETVGTIDTLDQPCPAGAADCDGDPETVCEVNIAVSLEHCGACNIPCAVNHGTANCVDGECHLTCDTGFEGPDCADCIDGYVGEACAACPGLEAGGTVCSGQGTCQVGEDIEIECVCDVGYQGEDCSEDVDECMAAPKPCDENATCTNLDGSFECHCNRGFWGDGLACDNADDCVPEPCVNGVCTDLVNDYACTCKTGWAGKDCDLNIDECVAKPCVHGKCIDWIAGYSCECDAGWAGKHCDLNIDECAAKPCVHGKCIDWIAGYSCECDAGWAGPNCADNIDGCKPNPCVHGTCADKVVGYFCSCSFGWQGKNCDKDIDECAMNNGWCGSAKHWQCINQPGQPPQCIDIDECATNNGGCGPSKDWQCVNQLGQPPECIDIDDSCDPNPCQHAGVCKDGVFNYTCKCALESYSGKNCETGPHTTGPLDVTYISRTPSFLRYCVKYVDGMPTLCPGTEFGKKWPYVGEAVTYAAHVINRDNKALGGTYTWSVNGVVKSTGSFPIIAVGAGVVTTFVTEWPAQSETITFSVNSGASLTIGSHDLTLTIWVETGLYEIFNATTNLIGTQSFEDWLQAQVDMTNLRFAQAKYPTSPQGIVDRLRIDKIIVTDQVDNTGPPVPADKPSFTDGHWQFVDNDVTNTKGKNGVWKKYVDDYVNTIDWGLVHEIVHQLGVIDLYRLNLLNKPEANNGVQVKDKNGQVIPVSKLPTFYWDQVLFEHPGMMGGGSTAPYYDESYFSDCTAAAMNTHAGYRRGYYGEYMFDTPTTNILRVVDESGKPLAAQVLLYQKAIGEYIDNTPEIAGTTNADGKMVLPNRPAPNVTTATGHTLHNNPFGKIDLVGFNGTMLVKATSGGQERFGWLLLTQLNLAYWSGQKEMATHTVTVVPLKP